MKNLGALLDGLREQSREEWPDSLLDDIAAAHEGDLSILEEKISSLDAGNGDLTSQVSSLKNELYDMSKLVSTDNSTDNDNDNDETENEEDDNEGDPIDDFFETEED